MPAHVADTTPYPWPFDGRLDAGNLALVVVGGGERWARCVPDDRAARENITHLRTEFSAAGMLVIVVRHGAVSSRIRSVVQPAPSLDARGDELAVDAGGIDGFYGGALDATLRRHQRSHLVICGYGFETAVHSTLRRANDWGYECLAVADASLLHDPELALPSRSVIEMSGGIFGSVGLTRDVLGIFQDPDVTPSTTPSTPPSTPPSTTPSATPSEESS